jgi:GNAT superfamily N-acetyltransferase
MGQPLTPVLRKLTADDAADVIHLSHVLNPDVEIADAAHFATIAARDEVTVMGAEIDQQIVAMATLHILPNMGNGGRPFGVIENVITLPQFQGRGVMRLVMERLHDIGWQMNAYKIMLMTGRDTGAKGFYEKLGYSGEQKHGMQIRRVPARKPYGT